MSTPHPVPFPQRIPAEVSISEIDLAAETFILAGERLTETRADELANRAARGVGRPPLSALGSTTINFRIEPSTKDRLAQVAHNQGKRPSDIARLALDKYLAEVA